MSTASPDPRSSRLAQFFQQAIHGKRKIEKPADAKLFIEALCNQEKRATCFEQLVASKFGLAALGSCVRMDTRSAFLNGPVPLLLRFLQDPEIKQLCSGQLLQQALESIVEPATFWNALVKANETQSLHEPTAQCFGWLLTELIGGAYNDLSDYRALAQELRDSRCFLDSASSDLRAIGQKLKHVLAVVDSPDYESGLECAGGRHDNDFSDFRQISIFPTPDELSSKEAPFLRQPAAVTGSSREKRVALHFDTHFRLLREDMMSELRADIQSAREGKKKRSRGLTIKRLTFEDIYCRSGRRRSAFGVVFRCRADVLQMPRADEKKRKEYLKANKNFARHQSLGCVISNGEILAFTTIDRNEDYLAQNPPALILRISDDNGFKKVLIAANRSTDFEFVQVDTAVFAYEPVLRRLQLKKELQLSEELIHLERTSELTDVMPEMEEVVESLEGNGMGLKDALHTAEAIRLDRSQADSLRAGLAQNVSLIQGPPGKSCLKPRRIVAHGFDRYWQVLHRGFTSQSLSLQNP